MAPRKVTGKNFFDDLKTKKREQIVNLASNTPHNSTLIQTKLKTFLFQMFQEENAVSHTPVS